MSAGAAALLTLRLFIGLGWLRAFAEKAPDPAWRDGAAVAAFLGERLARGEIALPGYQALVTSLFLPRADTFGWLVMAGQLLVGLGVLTGTLTRAALLGGLVMNLAFLLAGAPTPSAFYLVIQAVLLASGAGASWGLDAWLARRSGARWPVARPATAGRGRRRAASGAVLALGLAGYSLLHARDLSPAGSVHDPAVLLAVLAGLTALWATLMALPAADAAAATRPSGSRHRQRQRASRRPRAARSAARVWRSADAA